VRLSELLASKAVTDFSEEKMNPLKLIAAAILFVSLSSHAAEQPVYKVVQVAEVFEVRSYEPYVVAEVVLSGPAEEATEQAFSLLEGYIYGQNKTDKKIELTAPVIQMSLLGMSTGAAPAIQSADSAEWLVQLMMPKAYPLPALPEPLDPRVKLRQLPSQRFAVIQYSGSWSQSNYDEHLEILRQAMTQAGIVAHGEPVFARYDSEFMPWFLRTNEIWFRVQ
jgi:hypothetical protein